MRYHDIYTFCHYFKIRFTNQVVPTKMKLKYKSFNELNPVTEEKQINEPNQLTEEINAAIVSNNDKASNDGVWISKKRLKESQTPSSSTKKKK